MSPHSCSFVIPAYNEAKRLTATLDAIALLPASDFGKCEIIVVDDGSTDDTAEIARAFSSPHCPVSVYCLPHRGKGFAIRQGVSAARGEIVVLCDADLRESINEVSYLIMALGDGVDIAIGSRWLNAADISCRPPLFRRVSSRVFNLMAGHILAVPFKDTQCGLKSLTREAADRVFPLLSLDGWGYDLELLHVALALHLRVREVDLHLAHDYRDSHFRPISDGWAAFVELFRIRWNDIRGAYGSRALGQRFSRVVVSPEPNAISPPGMQADGSANCGIAARQLEIPQEHTDLCTPSELAKMSIVPSGDELAA
jgi:dolichyl-phosphate beta-glucosyltransferase